MNKIKIQLEQVIEKRLTYLVSNNFEFTVEGKPTQLSKIIGVELYMQKDFDEELRDGKIHIVSLLGIVSVIEKTKVGSELVNFVFRQSNVEITFDWDNKEFSIKDIDKFRFSKSRI